MREARDVMADLAASGLSPDQLALVMELTATLTVEARPAVDESAQRRRDRDRERKRNFRRIPQTSADNADPSPSLPLSPTPPISNPTSSCPSTPYSPPPSTNARPLKPTKAELDAIWEITPSVARTRSSRTDLERSLTAAMRRGHSPADVRAGIKAAYASPTYAGDMAKGVHRLIEADRWQSFTEGPTAEPDWSALVVHWTETDRWPASLGPPPDHPDTRVPALQRKVKAA